MISELSQSVIINEFQQIILVIVTPIINGEILKDAENSEIVVCETFIE